MTNDISSALLPSLHHQDPEDFCFALKTSRDGKVKMEAAHLRSLTWKRDMPGGKEGDETRAASCRLGNRRSGAAWRRCVEGRRMGGMLRGRHRKASLFRQSMQAAP